MDLNINPYFDDFDKNKNFLQILFRPGYAVQARELTQIQTILKNQIGSFADRIFQNNTPVIGASIDVNFDKPFVVFDSTDLQSQPYAPSDTRTKEQIITDLFNSGELKFSSQTTNTIIKITHLDLANNKVFFDYFGGKLDANGNENLELIDNTTGNPFPSNSPSYLSILTASTGTGILASVDNGIIYSNNEFVVVNAQETFVDKNSSTGDYVIGFDVQESIVDETTDSTLLDPANGSYNYNAPGATRLKVNPVLTSYAKANVSTAPASFFGQVEISNKQIIKTTNRVSYSDIMDMLAHRTYDQSGNYVVEDFNIEIKDNTTNPDTFDVEVGTGKAYVFGYEVENVSSVKVNVNRARTPEHIKTSGQVSHYVSYGPYVDIAKITTGTTVSDDIHGIFDISKMPEIVLLPQPGGAGNPLTDSNGNKIKLRIVNAERSSQDELRFFLYDPDGNIDFLTSAKSVGIENAAGTIVAWANLEKYSNGLPLIGGKDAGLPIVELEDSSVLVKSILPNQTTYQTTRTYNNITVTGGSITINADNNFMDFTPNGIVSIVDNAGNPITGFTQTTNNVVGGISTTTISGLGTATSVSLILKVSFSAGGAERKIKTRTQVTENLIAGRTNNKLSHADVVKIISVIDTTNGGNVDVTNSAILDTGQRDFFYDYGSVNGLDLSHQYSVTYEYYSHSTTGKFFSADSYPQADYDNGIYYTTEDGLTTYDLRNTLDFRPSIEQLAAGGNADIIISDGDPVTTEYDYYEGRISKLYLDQKGNFGIIDGIPARNPEAPDSIDEVLTLAQIEIPPYTGDLTKIDVIKKTIKRYTMEEIGRIDERLTNVEEYSARNLLENDALETNITQNGQQLFKSGILVDSFESLLTSDTENSEYRCTIDKRHNQLRGDFVLDHVDLFPSQETFTGLKKTKDLIMLDWTVSPFIVQDKASTTINVNPYAIHSWVGQIKLTPETDHWIDTVYYQDIRRTFGTPVRYQAWTTYGSWNLVWTGWRWTWGWRWGRTSRRWQRRRVITSKTFRRTVSSFRIIPTTSTTISDRIVSQERIPYMRPRNIKFVATNMRPGIELKAFFDGVDVSDKCTGLRTDNTGKAEGWFSLPAYTFKAGKKQFKLSDAVDGDAASYAVAFYESSGLLRKRQRTITTIHGSRVVRSTWYQTRRWIDPIAQSFLIDTPDKKGVFIDSIELYFSKKDNNLPITLYIVEMNNGQPTQNIIPHSEVTLLPSQVNVNTGKPTTPTTFKFDNPVYLQEQAEYAFVLMTNSNNYEVFIGELGGTNLIDNKGIFKQPYAGVMFKSQNSSTWTEDQTADIMFRINRCVFTPNTTYSVTFDSILKKIRVKPSLLTAYFNPDSAIVGTTSGARGIVKSQSNLSISIDTATISGGQFAVGDIITGQTSGAKAYIAAIKDNGSTIEIGKLWYAMNISWWHWWNNPSNYKFQNGETITNGTATATINLDEHYVLEVSTRNNVPFAANETITGGTANATFVDETDGIPTKWATTSNLILDTLNPNGTNVSFTYKFANDTTNMSIVPNQDVEFTQRKVVDNANPINVTVNLSTTSSYISPVVSNQRAGMILVDNDDWQMFTVASTVGFLLGEQVTGTNSNMIGIIKNIDSTTNTITVGNHNRQYVSNGETITGQTSGSTTTVQSSTADSLFGTYITKPVNLTNGANNLRVIFDSLLPSGTRIDGYYTTNKVVSKYVTIDNTGGLPAWANPANPLYKANQSIVGQRVWIYDITTAGTPAPTITLVTEAIVSKIDGQRVYLKSISDTTPFTGTITANNYAIVALNVDLTTISSVDFVAYTAGTAYTIGDFVIFGDMVWKANRSGNNLAQPSLTGSDWTLIPSALSTNNLVTEQNAKWKKLVYDNTPTNSNVNTTEIIMKPDEEIVETFDKFSIRLDLVGTNPAQPPIVENFKAIATL